MLHQRVFSKFNLILFVLRSVVKQGTLTHTPREAGPKWGTTLLTLHLTRKSYTRKHLTDKLLPKLVINGLLQRIISLFSMLQRFDQTLTAHQRTIKVKKAVSALSQMTTSHGRKCDTLHSTPLLKKGFNNQTPLTNKLKRCLEGPGLDYYYLRIWTCFKKLYLYYLGHF